LRWIAPTEEDTATVTLEERLWNAADQFRAYSGLKRQEYSGSALGLLFLRFTERVRRRRPHGYELYPECVCP
jgi:type I restriction enzyme M protein